jgi:hypothetical protein
MKTLERICIASGGMEDERAFFQYDRLAAELRSHTSVPVEVADRWSDCAAEGVMLLTQIHGAIPPDLPSGARIVLLNSRFDDLRRMAEEIHPAAIVVNERFSRWKLRQEDRFYRQLFAPKSLAPSLAPLLEPDDLKETEHYCMYESTETLALPALLSMYIDLYWRRL